MALSSRIVEHATKIDLHIHSVISSKKDGNKVANNTEENIGILVSKLKENRIDMCAITDHDLFSFSMYKKLKEYEGKGIKKVLPGVEFSVNFDGETVIHIVTIFDDKDEEKLKKAEEIIGGEFGQSKYKEGAFARDDYFKILQKIDLDFIMIAHQKKSVTSPQRPQKSDVLTLGREVFNELIFLEFFDAYEFRQKGNEVFNKKYALDNDFREKLLFLTGSDCHDWNYYPNSNADEQEMKFSYIRSLPTFRGLVMAVTDYHRINYTGSFWQQGKYLPSLELSINKEEIKVPLSRGINVIIGDNSIGKSLLLHELTEERYLDPKNTRLKKGYDKYRKDNALAVESKISDGELFKFNYQGQIRDIFEDDNMKADKYLSDFFPNEIDAKRYRSIAESELYKLYKLIETKFEYEDSIKQLSPIEVLSEDTEENELVLGIEIDSIETEGISELVNIFQSVLDTLKTGILNSQELDENDGKRLENAIELIELLHKKYKDKYEEKNREKEKINAFNTALKRYKRKYRTRQTDIQNKHNAFIEDKKMLAENIAKLLSTKRGIVPYKCEMKEVAVEPEKNPVGEFVFVSKIGVEKIDANYIEGVIRDCMKGRASIDIETLTREGLHGMMSRYPKEIEDSLEALKEKIESRLDLDFKVVKSIIEGGKDIYSDLSAGFNSRIYFKLLSGEERKKGIYIIDQPEDHIAQKAIKDETLEQFRNMAARRQIIMVTHNPQFIVNLDVDNVIFLGKVKQEKNEQIIVQSGALEYEDEKYSILQIVADNIDGGVDTIQRRVKRYEKNL